jgi:hypothetical protein
MDSRRALNLTLTALSLLALGCCCQGPNFWTEDVTEEIRIETAGIKCLEARTSNGQISFEGGVQDEAAAFVTVTKRGGGPTPEAAEDALNAIEIVVEPRGDDTKRISWKWRVPKQPAWGARVAYEIKSPAALAFDALTHNGRIEATGVNADAKLVTHNGRITVQSSGPRLIVESHNGRIEAEYTGGDLSLHTHNGRISANLVQSKLLSGKVSTHNGSITLLVGDDFSADMSCRTHNGKIKCDVPYVIEHASRAKLIGKIGDGGPAFSVITHNGSIHIKGAAAAM